MSKKTYVVKLTLKVDLENYSSPDQWPWDDLLDMDWDDVVLEDVREVR